LFWKLSGSWKKLRQRPRLRIARADGTVISRRTNVEDVTLDGFVAFPTEKRAHDAEIGIRGSQLRPIGTITRTSAIFRLSWATRRRD
jgi:hypothetical protein